MKHEVFLPQHLPNISTWLECCPDTIRHTFTLLEFWKKTVDLVDSCCPLLLLCVSESCVDLPVNASELPIQVWGQIFRQRLRAALTPLASPLSLLLPLSSSLDLRLSVHRHINPPNPPPLPLPLFVLSLSPYVVPSITFHFLFRLLNSSKNTWVAVITNVFLYVPLHIERSAVHPLKETAGLWRLRMRHAVLGS